MAFSTPSESPFGGQSVDEIVNGLSNLLIAQDAAIKSLKDSFHLRAFADTTHSQRRSLVSGGMHCRLRLSRPYNQEFQAALDDWSNDVETRRARANDVLAQFFAEAGATVTTFFNRYYHVPAGGHTEDDDASGDGSNSALTRPEAETETDEDPTELYASNAELSTGCWMHVSVLDDILLSIRAAKEVQAQLRFVAQSILMFPKQRLPVTMCPQLISHYRGRTILATAQSPDSLSPSLTVADMPDFALGLQYVSESLNIALYHQLQDDGTEQLTAGPPGATCRRGTDGRLYVETLVGLFPTFPPGRGTPVGTHHSLFMRPEAIARNRLPVSPGAYHIFGARDSAALRNSTRECSSTLCQRVAVEVAKALTAAPPASVQHVVALFHQKGLNIALMGIVLSHVAEREVRLRSLLWTEMVARAAKDCCREMATSATDKEGAMQAVASICAAVCAPHEHEDEEEDDGPDAGPGRLPAAVVGGSPTDMWDLVIIPRLRAKFPGSATLLSQKLRADPASVDRKLFLERLAEMLGVRFAAGVSDRGTSSFHFTIAEMRPVHKMKLLPEFVMGPWGAANEQERVSVGRATLRDSPSSAGSAATAPPNATAASAPDTSSTGGAKTSSPKSPQRGVIVETPEGRRQVAHLRPDSASLSFQLNRLDFLDGPASPQGAEDLISRRRRMPQVHATFLLGHLHAEIGHALLRNEDFPAALHYFNCAIDLLDRDATVPTTTTALTRAARSQTLFRLSKLSDAHLELDDATVELNQAALVGAPPDAPLSAMARRASRMSIATIDPNAGGGPGGRRVSAALPAAQRVNAFAIDLFGTAATIAEATDDLGAAETHRRNILRIQQRLLGERSTQVATAFHALGCTLAANEKLHDAADCFRRDIAILSALKGPNEVALADSYNNLACICIKLDQMPEAEEAYHRALDITKEHYGAFNGEVATCRSNMASALVGQRQYSKALEEFEAVIALREEALRTVAASRPTTAGGNSAFAHGTSSGGVVVSRPFAKQPNQPDIRDAAAERLRQRKCAARRRHSELQQHALARGPHGGGDPSRPTRARALRAARGERRIRASP